MILRARCSHRGAWFVWPAAFSLLSFTMWHNAAQLPNPWIFARHGATWICKLITHRKQARLSIAKRQGGSMSIALR